MDSSFIARQIFTIDAIIPTTFIALATVANIGCHNGCRQWLTGSCLCGGIQYEIHGPLTQALNCHCSMCRKAQGSAFRSRARVNSTDFKFIIGQALITYFESSPGNYRGFCKICGSPIYTKFDQHPDVFGLPLGALDDDPGIKPEFHVFVGSKAPWYEITDSLPKYDELPPNNS